MNLKEKYQNFIEYAGCEAEIQMYDQIIQTLGNSKLKNIAVLGGAGSGKTTLINKLSGKEVRKATALSYGETPLMVTFDSSESKAGFEKINLEDAPKEKQGFAFYEIPEKMAFEEEAIPINPVLEEMDAVIYVISANMPFTAFDSRNLQAIVNRFPVILYLSRTDCLENEEYEECLTYIRSRFQEEFEGAYCEIFDGRMADYENVIFSKLREIDPEEIREFHISRIDYAAKEIISAKLNTMLREVSKKREERTAAKMEADSITRDKELAWNDIRLTMLEKEQETLMYADRKIQASMISTKEELLVTLDGTANKKGWIEKELKKRLEMKINKTGAEISNGICENMDAHVAWLISEVNRRFGKRIQIDDVKRNMQRINSSIEACKETPGNKKILMAIGSGIVAGGAIFSSIPLIPTFIVAVPTSIFAVSCIKGSMEEQKEYHAYIIQYVETCCEDNFKKLKEQLHTTIKECYAKIISTIIQISEDTKEVIGFQDIEDAEREIRSKIEELASI